MIEKIGGEVSRGVLLGASGIYIVFPIIIAVAIFFVLSKFLPCFLKEERRKKEFSPLFLWIAICTYCGIFGTMSVLRYLSFHTAFFDLGIYDHSVWNIAELGDLSYLAWGHFRPIVGVYALFYKLFPSAITLLLLQTLAVGFSAVPLYYIAKKKLGQGFYALLIVIIYFLYSPVAYNNLFDFHADHLIILLMFWGFYFLERDKPLAFFLVCLPGLFLKEPLILSIGAMGLYAIVRYRMYKTGTILFVGSLLFFFLVVNVLLPGLNEGVYGGELLEKSFSYLGSSVFEIARNIFLHPGIIAKEIGDIWKMGYLAFLFVPLLLIPLLSPLSLLPALPALAISLLSQWRTHYWIQYQYTASLIAPIFISLIYGLKFLKERGGYPKTWFRKHFRINLSKNQFLKTSLFTILIVSIYYNITLSPSPISIFFWRKIMRDYYQTSYIITERDEILDDAIRKFIPEEASVTSQNTVNNSYLAHRAEYHSFVWGTAETDYVVLDQKRAGFIRDETYKREYKEKLKKLSDGYEIVFSYDGIYIFERVK